MSLSPFHLVGYLVLVSCVMGTALHWLHGGTDSRWLDGVFMAVSTVTSTGLAVQDYTAWNRALQVLLFVGMIMGSNILLAAVPCWTQYRECRQRLLVLTTIIPAREGADDDSASSQRSPTVLSNEGRELEINAAVALLVGRLYVGLWLLLVTTVFLLLSSRFPLRWALFLSVSTVNNVGLSPSTSDFAEYRNEMFVIAVCSAAMPLGNALFPVLLRIAVHAVKAVLLDSQGVMFVAASRVLADPRGAYTHLLSAQDTKALSLLWVGVTVGQLLIFLPDIRDTTNTLLFPSGASTSEKLLLALFQTVAVRTTGFEVMPIASLRVGHLVFWLLAMYLSAYPVALHAADRKVERRQTRRTLFPNVAPPSTEVSQAGPAERQRGTIARAPAMGSALAGCDVTWLYIAVVLLLFVEDRRMDLHAVDPSSGFLRTTFEVISAFGNVGLSLARSTAGIVSYCAEFKEASRAVVMLLMIAGKLRCIDWDVAPGGVRGPSGEPLVEPALGESDTCVVDEVELMELRDADWER